MQVERREGRFRMNLPVPANHEQMVKGLYLETWELVENRATGSAKTEFDC